MLQQTPSRYRNGSLEGVVVRRDSIDWCEARAKLVRPDFTQAIEEHWSRRRVEWNRIGLDDASNGLLPMNPLQRALIEKAGHDNGFEYVLPSDEQYVALESARYPARARVAVVDQGFEVGIDTGSATLAQVVISPRVSAQDRQALSLSDNLALRWIAAEHLRYLRFHRQRLDLG